MRAGIYLRAGAETGFSPFERSRSFASSIIEHLAASDMDDEVVFYGSHELLTRQFIYDLSFGPVLTSEAIDSGALTGANQFFRRLPNGARSRVLFRVLPSAYFGPLGVFLDQLLLLFYSWLDQIDVMHALDSKGFFGLPTPLIVTPPEHRGSRLMFDKLPKKNRTEPPPVKQDSLQTQSVNTRHVIVPSEESAASVYREEGIDPTAISVVPPGLDKVFSRAANAVESGYSPALDHRIKSRAGCVIVPLPSGLDEAAKASLRAWSALGEGARGRGLLLLSAGSLSKRAVGNVLGEDISLDDYEVFPRFSLELLPGAVFHSDVVLAPHLRPSEAGLLLGALALQTPVVVSQYLRPLLPADDRAFFCKPQDESSINVTLSEALENTQVPQLKRLVRSESPDSRGQLERIRRDSQRFSRFKRGAKLFRTMEDVVEDTFEVYRRVYLRYKTR